MRKNALEIILEDPYIIVVKKPAGIATQNSRPGTPDMESLIKNYLYKKTRSSIQPKTEPYLAVIHRLDQPVSGILVFAKTPAAAKDLNSQITSSGFGKYYKALLVHAPIQPEGTLTDYMKKNSKSNTSSICTRDTPGGKKAILHYKVCPNSSKEDQALFQECKIADYTSLTLVTIHLETGRHHQIRVQMAHMGCPIYGDSKYGTVDKGTWKNIALCAYQLSFHHPVTKELLEFRLDL